MRTNAVVTLKKVAVHCFFPALQASIMDYGLDNNVKQEKLDLCLLMHTVTWISMIVGLQYEFSISMLQSLMIFFPAL